MFVRIGIHRPREGKEQILIDSMHRLGETMERQPGLQQVHALRDEKKGAIIGLAIWDDKGTFTAALSALLPVLEQADFDDWLTEPIEMYELEEV